MLGQGLAALRTLYALLHAPFEHHATTYGRGEQDGVHQVGQLHCASSYPVLGEHAVADHVTQGKNLVHLIDRPDEPHCFRLQKDRVFYVSESSMRLAISVARPNLISLGTCFGKFTKSGKFKLHITALDYLAQYAKYKVCCM